LCFNTIDKKIEKKKESIALVKEMLILFVLLLLLLSNSIEISWLNLRCFFASYLTEIDILFLRIRLKR
jgi:hypothetical protein